MKEIDFSPWGCINPALFSVRGQTSQWEPYSKSDCAENYYKKIKSSEFSKFTTYTPEDFSYTINNFGFRGDDFILGADLDLLVGGCSFTFGSGLPIEDLWWSQLGEMLGIPKESIGNVGVPGCGVETVWRQLYFAIKKLKMRPKIVFALFPNIARSEGFVNNLNFVDRQQNTITYLNPRGAFSNDIFAIKTWDSYMERVNIKDRVYALINTVLSIQTLCETIGAIFVWDTWGAFWEYELNVDRSLAKFYLPVSSGNGDALDIQKCIDYMAPPEVKQANLSSSVQWYDEAMACQKLQPNEISKYNIARDFMHPGPNCHLNYAKQAYFHLKKSHLK